jgi:hypothetical protein
VLAAWAVLGAALILTARHRAATPAPPAAEPRIAVPA